MPSLPRIKRPRSRTRADVAVVPARREPAELPANGLTWIHLDAPDQDVSAELAERFGWHPLDVEDVLSKRQRPKVDEYPDYLFGVLHFPFYDKAVQRLNAAELDFFLGQGYLVTLPNVELLPVSRLFQRCVDDQDLRDNLFSKGSGYLLYHVLDDLFDYCFPILDKIGFKLDSIEDDVLEGRSEEAVRDISNVKQEIISYRKIIKPQRPALRLLERRAERFLPEELELYFDDLVDASERIWDLLDNYKEVVEALETTNEQVLSHRFNDVLRILTVFSIVFLPATLIASLWGMNIGLPGGGDPAASSTAVFWIIIAASVAVIGACSASSATSAGSETGLPSLLLGFGVDRRQSQLLRVRTRGSRIASRWPRPPAAGLGTTGRRALVVAVFVVTAVLIVLNPWLAVFALAGFALGWAIRSRGRILTACSIRSSASARRLVTAGGIAVAVISIITYSVVTQEPREPDQPLVERVIPVAYSATAKLREGPDLFAFTERLTVPKNELEQVSRAGEFRRRLTRELARLGWAESRSLGDRLEFRRGVRTQDAGLGFFTRRETVALTLPSEIRGTIGLLASTAAVVIDAPKHSVLATTPPSDAETIARGRERRQVALEDVQDSSAIEVELAGPRFRGELGAWLLGFSFGGVAKWGILIVIGIFQDELRQLLRRISDRLLGRRRTGPAATAPPSSGAAA